MMCVMNHPILLWIYLLDDEEKYTTRIIIIVLHAYSLREREGKRDFIFLMMHGILRFVVYKYCHLKTYNLIDSLSRCALSQF